MALAEMETVSVTWVDGIADDWVCHFWGERTEAWMRGEEIETVSSGEDNGDELPGARGRLRLE